MLVSQLTGVESGEGRACTITDSPRLFIEKDEAMKKELESREISSE